MTMQQPKLLDASDVWFWKSVHLHHVKASFLEIAERVHEVILEINSQKFLVRVKAWLKQLEQFEILAVKGCVEICMSTLKMLKRLLTSLYFEY